MYRHRADSHAHVHMNGYSGDFATGFHKGNRPGNIPGRRFVGRPVGGAAPEGVLPPQGDRLPRPDFVLKGADRVGGGTRLPLPEARLHRRGPMPRRPGD